MITINKKHLILFLIVFFLFSKVAYASLLITEVMYNPDGTDTDREWIKLYNNGSETIEIVSGRADSAWRFSDDIEGKELHLINNELVIAPGGYAVLASNKDTFITEYPDFNGPVADTSMSLGNVSGMVRIWDGSLPRNMVASKEYPYNDAIVANEEISPQNNVTTSVSGSVVSLKSKPTEIYKTNN